jgi:hypothetical protein
MTESPEHFYPTPDGLSTQGIWSELLMCFVRGYQFDPELGVGILYIEDGGSADMSGCIEFFEGIGPTRIILTQEGDQPGTVYVFNDGEWKARIFWQNAPMPH